MQRLDLLHWLQRDPNFSSAWVAYDSLGRVGNYAVWARHGTADDISRPLPVALAPQGPSALDDDGSNSASLVSAAAFLTFLFIIYTRQRTLMA
jgi:hypothetical protein